MDEYIRKVAVLTTTRAEYGILQPLLHSICKHSKLDLQLLVSGTHLSKSHGYTVNQIEEDGFDIAAIIPMDVEVNSKESIASAAGLVMSRSAQVFADLQPDLLVVLGDRYEILSVVQASWISRIPVVHIHGGEITVGAIDDGIRHAVTKLSHVHFASTVEHAARIKQMGEDEKNIFITGAPGLENLQKIPIMPVQDFLKETGLPLGSPRILMTLHPETTINIEDNLKMVDEVMTALKSFKSASILITGSNSDPGAIEIMSKIKIKIREIEKRACYCESLGLRKFVAALRYCDVMIGNSSSGIIEAPSAPLPVVNIGRRQEGRPRANSVIDCPADHKEIVNAIKVCLSKDMQETLQTCSNPYASPVSNIGEYMATILAELDLSVLNKPKLFIDKFHLI